MVEVAGTPAQDLTQLPRCLSEAFAVWQQVAITDARLAKTHLPPGSGGKDVTRMDAVDEPEEQTSDVDELVRYRLPVTTISITGVRTRVENRMAEPAVDTTSREASALIQIDADPRAWLALTNPGPRERSYARDRDRDFKFDKTPDGRLLSINATVTNRSAERLKASVQVGSAVAGTLGTVLVPAVGPLGGVTALAAGLVTGAATYTSSAVLGVIRVDSVLLEELIDSGTYSVDEQDKQSSRPDLTKLGIPTAYIGAHKDAAELLGDLKWSELQILATIAKATTPQSLRDPASLSVKLRDAQRALVTVRTALEESERDCAAWIATQAKITKTPFEGYFYLDEIPTTSELQKIAADGFRANDPRRCAQVFKHLRFAITCDLLDPDPDETSAHRSGAPREWFGIGDRESPL